MTRLGQQGAIALAGFGTSIATVAIVMIVAEQTGFSLFRLTVVFLPVGALLCGTATASGYYACARLLHVRPNRSLLIQMVLLAAFAQIFIYWYEYSTANFDGILLSKHIGFTEYLDLTLTRMQVRTGRTLQHITGEVGWFGYVIATVNFIGFLLGGAIPYVLLLDHTSCKTCDQYLKSQIKTVNSFEDENSFVQYYHGVFAYPLDSPAFANYVGGRYGVRKLKMGVIRLDTNVMACPNCGNQTVLEKVRMRRSTDWTPLRQAMRRTDIPPGLDVVPAYRSGEPARFMQQAKSGLVKLQHPNDPSHSRS